MKRYTLKLKLITHHTVVKVVQPCPTLCHPWTQPSTLLCLWDSPESHWSGLPFPPPGDLPDPGIEPGSPTLQADFLPSMPPGEPSSKYRYHLNIIYL